jgi:hypothetical protein
MPIPGPHEPDRDLPYVVVTQTGTLYGDVPTLKKAALLHVAPREALQQAHIVKGNRCGSPCIHRSSNRRKYDVFILLSVRINDYISKWSPCCKLGTTRHCSNLT